LSSIVPIVDFSLFDHAKPIASLTDVNGCNHQRFEMGQLDGILFEELETNRCVGYKDTSAAEFWVRGHMPGFALMPGVVMCEAAAQVSSYFTVKYDLLGCDVVGLGGIENVRFRGSLFPGERLTMMVRGTKLRRGGLIACEFQGWVDQRIIVTGELKGVPLFEASRVLGRAKP
jgi:3-hydroxyacyl-[acyl-carrier-protein] dehydratase